MASTTIGTASRILPILPDWWCRALKQNCKIRDLYPRTDALQARIGDGSHAIPAIDQLKPFPRVGANVGILQEPPFALRGAAGRLPRNSGHSRLFLLTKEDVTGGLVARRFSRF